MKYIHFYFLQCWKKASVIQILNGGKTEYYREFLYRDLQGNLENVELIDQ